MRIGEVASKSGMPASTLRYYERIGLIDVPRSSSSGHRDYSEDIFQLLDIIKKAQRNGFSLAEIHTLLHSDEVFSQVWQRIARQKLLEIEQRIAKYESMRDSLQIGLVCDCISLETCHLIA
ncbi:MAG: MerR family transcriptional regulator [Chloroflexota bacterium]